MLVPVINRDGEREPWMIAFTEKFSTSDAPQMARTVGLLEMSLAPEQQVVLETDLGKATVRVTDKVPVDGFRLGLKVLVQNSGGQWGFDPRPVNP